jgi:hypothetical protein
MPYNSQDVHTTEGSLRIELSYLLKQKLIPKGGRRFGTLSWTNHGQPSGSIGYEICFTDSEKWMRLYYTITDFQGNKKDIDYKVYFDSVKSNLGIGEVYYFLCPQTFKRCRILYSAYHCEIFKSREAYQHRIYYPSQTLSKRFYAYTRYFNLEEQTEKMYKTKMKKLYKGKITKSYKRFLKNCRILDRIGNQLI